MTINPVSIAADRELLTSLYDAAVAAVDPTPATTRAIEELDIPRGSAVWLFAFGKAAPAMARGAISWAPSSVIAISSALP